MPAEKYRVELTSEKHGKLLAVDVSEYVDLRMSEAEATRTYRPRPRRFSA